MGEQEELEFIKSMYPDTTHDLLKVAVSEGRVAAMFQLKSNGIKRIYYSDLVLGFANSYSDRSDKKTFNRLAKWMTD